MVEFEIRNWHFLLFGPIQIIRDTQRDSTKCHTNITMSDFNTFGSQIHALEQD